MSSHGSATLTIDDIPATEKPQNGVAGLKHWRYDLMAGLQVAMMGIPLSLGIAIASGAPPVCGLISAIIAGFVFPFLGGAYITISGPAAGLAPALLAGTLALGHGDLEAGYPLLLVAISIVGVVQVILSIFNAGRFALFFPISVVEGMLMAIGMLIIIKQVPAFLGYITPPIKSIPKAIISDPRTGHGDESVDLRHWSREPLPPLFYYRGILSRIQATWAKLVPVPLIVIAMAGLIAWILGLEEKYLIHVPLDVFEHGIVFPILQKPLREQTYGESLLLIIITLTLIDGTESLATIQAIDKIDPFKRKSNPNVTLRAMGVSNTLSSLAGGLTIIPGGLKSTTNMLAGGRTLWANFYYAMLSVDHPVVRRNPHQSNSQIGPGGAAHVDRMETLLAQSLQADLLGRQGTDIDRHGQCRGHLMDLGPTRRHDRRHADKDCHSREGCCTGFGQGSPGRWGRGRIQRIVPQSRHPHRRQRRGCS